MKGSNRMKTTTKIVSEYLKYDFSEDETSANAKKLARTNRALAEHGLKKKQLATDLKQQEEGLATEIAELSRFVTDGLRLPNDRMQGGL